MTSCEKEQVVNSSDLTFDDLVLKHDLESSSSVLNAPQGYTLDQLKSLDQLFATLSSNRGKTFKIDPKNITVTRPNLPPQKGQQKLAECFDPSMILVPAHCVSDGGHITADHYLSGSMGLTALTFDFDYNPVNGYYNWEASNITSKFSGFSGPATWHQTHQNSSFSFPNGFRINVYGYISISGSGGYVTSTYHFQVEFDPWSKEWSVVEI